MAENDRAPRLRFKGFTEDWEQRELGKCGTTYTGLSGKNKGDFGHGHAKYVTYMNVFTNPIANTDMLDSVEVDNMQHEVQYGDVFITTSSETPDEVGMSSVWLGKSENVYLNSFCFGFRPSVRWDEYYLGYLLRSNVVRDDIILLAQGISRYNISKTKFLEINVKSPSLGEQAKIGIFLKSVDEIIGLYQSKYEKLVETKESLLDNMFPTEGESAPKIRLEGYADAWKRCKLGSVATIIGGGTPSTYNPEYWDGNIDWYAPAEISDQIYVNSSSRKITEEGLASCSSKILPAGTVLFTSRAGIGKTAILAKPGCTNQGFQSIVPKEGLLDSYFIFSRTEELKAYGEAVGGGSTFVEVSGKQMSDMDLMMPSTLAEQKAIGLFFKNLDHIIALQKQTVEKLRNMKSALLEKMFV